MGELTFDQLKDRLGRSELGGSFFLKTEDPFLRDQAIQLLVAAHIGDSPSDFDLDQLSGDSLDPDDLAARIDTPPVLAPYRVIVIRRAQGLSPSGRSVVEAAAARTVAGRVLIVSAEIPRGSKAKFYKVLAQRCTIINTRAPRPSELPGWLAARARTLHGAELDMSAAQLLVAGIGPRLGVLTQELEKLVTLVGAGVRIGVEEVRSAVGALPQVDRWRWVDAVVEGKVEEALADLPTLLDSGESAVGLIGALSEAFIRGGLARLGDEALVRVLKRDGSYYNLKWKVGTYAVQGRNWSEEALAGALAELLEADRLIKSGALAGRAALEEALLRISALAKGRTVTSASRGV